MMTVAPEPDPHQLHPDHLPTPFTAAEIRAACPPGRTLRFRIQHADEEPMIRVSRYVEADAVAAVQESWQEGLDGQRRSEPERERSTWIDLQEHASFPRTVTERGEDQIAIPAGEYACLRYVRTDPDAVWRFWFAHELPGQPVRYEREVSAEIVFSAVLIENTP
jgi:hypothetical protein